MGILDEIQNNSGKSTYNTESKITNLIKDILFSKEESKDMIMYTGIIGMYIFQLYMMGLGVPLVYFTFTHYHKTSNIIVLNLFKKSGLIKAVINTRTRSVEIREGTNILKTAFKFEEIGDYLTSLEPKEPKEFYLRNGRKKFIK